MALSGPDWWRHWPSSWHRTRRRSSTACASSVPVPGRLRSTTERLAGGRDPTTVHNIRARCCFTPPGMLDVIVCDREALIAFADRRGHPSLRACVVVDDPDFVDALKDWYDDFIWEPRGRSRRRALRPTRRVHEAHRAAGDRHRRQLVKGASVLPSTNKETAAPQIYSHVGVISGERNRKNTRSHLFRAFTPALIAATVLMGVACAALDPPPPPSNAVLILLLDSSSTGVATCAAQRRHIEDVVVTVAVAHRAEVAIALIDDNAIDDPQIVSLARRSTLPPPSATPSLPTTSRRPDRPACCARSTTCSRPPAASKASDVAGAVEWAADTLRQKTGPGWRAIAVLADATSTVTSCNFTLTRPGST